jgi:hypothetical protein
VRLDVQAEGDVDVEELRVLRVGHLKGSNCSRACVAMEAAGPPESMTILLQLQCERKEVHVKQSATIKK